MTKKEMIKTMQEQEAKRWERLKDCEDFLGKEDESTKRAQCRWGTLYRLMQDLEIETKRI